MKYYLVLEARPGDFMPIDINIILNNLEHKEYTSLSVLDEFTKGYTFEEIKSMIKDSNIASEIYLNGDLKIINENKYRYMIITKDIDFSLDNFFLKYIEDKQMMNKFMNIYLKYCKASKEQMKDAIFSKDISKILNVLFSNTYIDVRNIYTYIYEHIILKDS